MDLFSAVAVYFVLVIMMMICLIRSNMVMGSAFILSIVVGQIILNILYPPNLADPWGESDSTGALYFTIQIITPLLAIIYLIRMAWNDRKRMK